MICEYKKTDCHAKEQERVTGLGLNSYRNKKILHPKLKNNLQKSKKYANIVNKQTKLKKVIQVVMLRESIIEQTKKYHTKYKIKEVEENFEYYRRL